MNAIDITAGLSLHEIEQEIDRLLTRADHLSKVLEDRRQQLREEERSAIALAAQRTKRALRRVA